MPPATSTTGISTASSRKALACSSSPSRTANGGAPARRICARRANAPTSPLEPACWRPPDRREGPGQGHPLSVNGVPETAFADSEVVLSSGSIGSCQLMLLSGIGPADELSQVGIDPVHDLPGVGKDLQDHINMPITFYTKDRIGVGAWTDETLEPTSRSGRHRAAARAPRPGWRPADSSGAGPMSNRTCSFTVRSPASRLCALPVVEARHHAAYDTAAAGQPRRDPPALGQSGRVPGDRSALLHQRRGRLRHCHAGRGHAHQSPDRGAIAPCRNARRRNHAKRRMRERCRDRPLYSRPLHDALSSDQHLPHGHRRDGRRRSLVDEGAWAGRALHCRRLGLSQRWSRATPTHRRS